MYKGASYTAYLYSLADRLPLAGNYLGIDVAIKEVLPSNEYDVAKYFAILPALFLGAFPELRPLDVMGLSSPYSAILSAVIFNALIIIALIPLALRGVRYRPLGAAALLRRSLLLYGVGGVLVPFLGIKAIDLVLTAVGLV